MPTKVEQIRINLFIERLHGPGGVYFERNKRIAQLERFIKLQETVCKNSPTDKVAKASLQRYKRERDKLIF